MIRALYDALAAIGYTHPLHPPITHLPVGLIIGGFIFALVGTFLKRTALQNTARHCYWLALFALPVAAAFGLMDWQRFYGGAWLMPIVMKMILAVFLLAILLIALIPSRQKPPLAYYGVALLAVVAIGFFGGELVYGTREDVKAPASAEVEKGSAFFAQNCAMCHYTDQTETKIGPGLKDLFQRESLPVSGKPVTTASIEAQLRSPVQDMPAFPDIDDENLNALTAYLKTL